LWRPRLEETSKRLFKRTFGKGDDSIIERKKNAFRYPNHVDSEFPQAEKPVYIDKRAKSARREFLIRDIGIKMKNQIKQQIVETRNMALRKAEARGEGREREDDVININNIVNSEANIDIDELDMDKFTLNDKKTKKPIKNKKETGMEIEDNNFGKKENYRKNRNKKKKNKSFYLVNY
jgi:hypothetical protein